MKVQPYYFEIPTTDIQRAKTFYEYVFDCSLVENRVNDDLIMYLFTDNNLPTGSLIHSPKFYTPSKKGVLLYINADPDLQVVLSKVEQKGGRVDIEKREISKDYGYMGVFQDTEGNRIALHSKA